MKKLLLSFLVVSLLLPGIAPGQSKRQGKSTTRKASTVSGQVSQDGKSLIGKDGKPWLLENPGALAGHEGQQVKVRCQIPAGGQEIHVLSVKTVATQTKYAVNLGDSAFRR